MPLCPSCEQDVPDGAAVCDNCGAVLRPTRPIGRYVVSLAALVAIIAAAILIHSLLRPRVMRDPVEFLPSSARLALGVDVRPEGPPMSRVREVWSASDADHLALQATGIAQDLVDFAGIELNLRDGASHWFGGSVVVASLAGVDGPFLGPRAWVVIARVTDPRRARADLSHAVSRLAEEADWSRSVVSSGNHDITCWGRPGGRSHFAYATRDGCLLVSASSAAVAECLGAADEPSERLAASAGFMRASEAVPEDALLWCYASPPRVLAFVREAIRRTQQGWLGLRRYLGGSSAAGAAPGAEADSLAGSSSLAVAVRPEADGVSISAYYGRDSEQSGELSASRLRELAAVLPAGTAACALLHRPQPWVAALLDEPFRREGTDDGRHSHGLAGLLAPFLTIGDLPQDVMVALLPRDQHDSRPAVIVGMVGEMPVSVPLWLRPLMPRVASARIAEVTVYATDEEAIRQCESAAHDAAQRLGLEVADGTRAQAWAQPGRLSRAFAHMQEVQLSVREDPASAQMDIHIKAEPRHLLGPG